MRYLIKKIGKKGRSGKERKEGRKGKKKREARTIFKKDTEGKLVTAAGVCRTDGWKKVKESGKSHFCPT